MLKFTGYTVLAGALGAGVGSVLLPTGLAMAGFSAIGPVAGSYAAAWMGPAVASGSWYAAAQAAAMGGASAGAFGWVATGAGAVTSAAVGAVASWPRRGGSPGGRSNSNDGSSGSGGSDCGGRAEMETSQEDEAEETEGPLEDLVGPGPYYHE